MVKRSRLDAAVLEQVLLRRQVPGDSLLLTDEVLRAALDGRRVLTAEERRSLQSSPMTLRRFRALSQERHAAVLGAPHGRASNATSKTHWDGSSGLLLAAESGTLSGPLYTSDGFWSLHFVEDPGRGLLVILKLSPQAPFAGGLVSDDETLAAGVDVLDGEGGLLFSGKLDADGELHVNWIYDILPWVQIARAGGVFRVAPAP